MRLYREKKHTILNNLAKLFFLVLLFFTGYLILIRFEGEKPVINFKSEVLSLGNDSELKIFVSDKKCGIKKILIEILQNGKSIILFEKKFPFKNILRGGSQNEDNIFVKVESRKLGLSDGKAILKVYLWDYSWRNFFRGNNSIIEKEVTVDTLPPELTVLSKAHNINQGGSGLAIYKLSKYCLKSGVYVGNNFFPGYFGYFKDKNIYLVFFALDYNENRNTEIYIYAVDRGDNFLKVKIPYHIRKKKFKRDAINLNDTFIISKLQEFNLEKSPKLSKSLADNFIIINKDMRKDNTEKILAIGEKSDNKLYWKGEFLRMPNSAPMASFADHRDYKYNGKIIDSQTHLGVDLASLEKSQIPSANAGKVVFIGNIGIYGNTIVIDHGFGLFSMYSHLSGFKVQNNQIVSKGDILGITGNTGLAGGDHLHFGMFIHKTFINPVEWWDTGWIKDNVLDKIQLIER